MTVHGGMIALGFPTVLIGGMPAARATDLHVCPMLTGNVPHVGGPIQTGSPTVLIGGQKAARVGDVVTCSGPPDTISAGCETVLIGGAVNAGGGAGGGSVSSASASAQVAATMAFSEEHEPVYPYMLVNPEASGYQDDDRFILETTDGSYSETLTYADARGGGYSAVLRFPDPPRGARYRLCVELASRPDRDATYDRSSYTIFDDEPLMRYEPVDDPSPDTGLRS